MKNKNVAGILALFFGVFGVHRFYLGQTGLGILYCVLFLTGISAILGLIDALVFFTTDRESFDFKYNRRFIDARRRYPHESDFDRRDRDYRRGYREEKREMRRERRAQTRENSRRQRDDNPERKYSHRKQEQTARRRTTRRVRPAANPFRQEGVRKFKEYDYAGAITAFEKALEINPQDIAVHFNLACTYSLTENKKEALYHLDRAVAFGFKDFKRIREHDALAWLRIQKEYDNFESNNFRLEPQKKSENTPEEDLLNTSPNLLEQLKKLSELRQKGLLTEAEFAAQKRKLTG